jgi:hypothetical protein
MEKKVEELIIEYQYIKTVDGDIYDINLKNFINNYKIINKYNYNDILSQILIILNHNKIYNNYKIAYLLYKIYYNIKYYDLFTEILTKMETNIDISKIEFIKEKYDFIDKINMNYINDNFNIDDYQNCILIFFNNMYNNLEMTFEEIIVKYMLINNKIKNNEKDFYYKKYKIKYIKLKEINNIWNITV